MVFAAAIATLLLYFIRPQDWISFIEGANVVRPVIAAGLIGLFMRRRGSRTSGPLPFFKTPHEWLMLAYLGYIVFTSPDSFNDAKEALSQGAFFFITLHAIQSSRQLQLFLGWWRWAVLGIVVMALGTVYGFDFTGSASYTEAMFGRLSLRSWLLNNPNALGHTLASLLPLLYLSMFRGKGFVSKLLALALMLLTGLCIWHTQSKGSYLVGAAGMTLALLIGRPLWMKAAFLALAIGGGQAALSSLPRMTDVSSLRNDEGVMGRLMAWDIARSVTRNKSTGEGWKRFNAVIRWEGEDIPKATHSSYVKIGGDLGLPGLFLYLSVLCLGARTLLVWRAPDDRMEEQRRLLLTLLGCYAISGWMIDRAYHTEFFMITGAITAYHALCVRAVTRIRAEIAHGDIRPSVSAPFQNQVLRPSKSWWQPRLTAWRSYSLMDAGIAICALQAVLATWDYILVNL